MFGSGSINSEIVLIEDFPYYVEYINKKLYLSGTGYTYQSMLANVNLKREQIFTTCLFGTYGKSLREYYYDRECTKIKYEHVHYIKLLLDELLKLPNLKIIMPLGDGSLQAITGLKGITNYRGSILPVSDEFCKEKKNVWKVIPTLSPRDVNVNYPLRVYVNIDLKKALKQKDIKDFVKPIRRMIVNPSFIQASSYLEDILKYKRKISVDIETKGRDITCIGFAVSPVDSICIPFYHTNMKKYWINIQESNFIENLVKSIVNDENIPKIYQNGMFDTWVMGNSGYKPRGLVFDTMYAQHLLFCELEKDLGTLTSIYTDENYYKFERVQAKKVFAKTIKPVQKEIKDTLSLARKWAKKRATIYKRIKRTAPLKPTPKRILDLESWKEEKIILFNEVLKCMKDYKEKQSKLNIIMEKFDYNADVIYYSYNNKDCLVTYEISIKQEVELKERGLWEFYNKYYISMFPIAYDISMKGLRIDEDKRKIVAEQVHKGLEDMRQEIYKRVGYEFNTESPKQLCKVLYETLKLPVQVNKGRITTDVKALDKLIEKTNHPVLEDIIDIRKLAKLESTYLNSKLDNGYIRSEMVIAHTTSGRWASRKSPFGSGGNLQNIVNDKSVVSDRVLKVLNGNKNVIRDCFITDNNDEYFIEVDLSGAEVYYVAFCSKDEILMNALLNKEDTHRLIASIYLEKSPELVTKEERQVAKRINHGFHYGMQPQKMATITKLPISFIIRAYDKLKIARPMINEYHRWVEQCIISDRVIYNAFGRPRIFLDRTPYKWVNNKKVAIPDEIYRSGYSYYPQSSVGSCVDTALLRLEDTISTLDYIRVALQIHDALLNIFKKKYLHEVVKYLYDAFDIEQTIWGNSFKIPIDFSIGTRWGSMVKLPVVDGMIDMSKSKVYDKEMDKEVDALWVKLVEGI